jgi:hypothetical protein
MICNNVIIDSRSDSANCGGCGNVCGSGFECVNSACKRITSMTSSTTITCNAQTVKPYSDRDNCTGCGIKCGSFNYCNATKCINLPRVGNTITFGSYEQDNDTSNGKEPISWIVLDRKSNGQMLVISEKVLDVQPYNTTRTTITWEKSTIRSWLNGYGASYNKAGKSYASDNFINTAFTAAEKAKIVSSTVPAHANPSYSTSPGNATTDKIFLLSITEANNYFATNAKRLAVATEYAVKKGVRGTHNLPILTHFGNCDNVPCYAFWWLRSPGNWSTYAAGVQTDGSVNDYGTNGIESTDHSFRPALWVQY